MMLELFPQGFEEVDRDGGVELAAYTDAGGEERLWQASAARARPRSRTAGRSAGATSTGPSRSGGSGSARRGRRRRRPALVVVIDPGRAFGTGAHPTTQLCLELLQELEPGSLLDVGCGSGVLSIAAALLGYAPVVGVDIEEAAVDATRANAARERGRGRRASSSRRTQPLPAADVIVANISLDAVRSLPGRVDAARLVTSGYLAARRADARRATGASSGAHARRLGRRPARPH